MLLLLHEFGLTVH